MKPTRAKKDPPLKAPVPLGSPAGDPEAFLASAPLLEAPSPHETFRETVERAEASRVTDMILKGKSKKEIVKEVGKAALNKKLVQAAIAGLKDTYGWISQDMIPEIARQKRLEILMTSGDEKIQLEALKQLDRDPAGPLVAIQQIFSPATEALFDSVDISNDI